MELHEVFAEVPVLPAVVPLAGLVLAVLLWHLQRRDLLSVPRAAVAVALCVYAAGVVAHTVFPIYLDKPVNDASWTTFVNLTPFVGYEVADAVMNICVFVPIGILVPLVARRPSWLLALAVSTVASLVIEVTQWVTAASLGGGHIADVNDLLFNVVGGALGYGLFLGLSQVAGAARLLHRFRWA